MLHGQWKHKNRCTVDKCYSEQADKPHCPAQVLPECNVCNVFARSTTYNSLWRLRNDSRGIFFMQWPTAQMRRFLCSCFIDRPGSLSPFFCTECAPCAGESVHKVTVVHSVTGCSVLHSSVTGCTVALTLVYC